MILVDISQVIISSLMASLGSHSEHFSADDEDLLRHFVLNSIRSYNHKFKDEYGELIIAADAGNYWRKDIFPYYKYRRKIDRDASSLDWNAIFQSLNKIRDELQEYFPYRVIRAPRAEADDVIATLCHQFGNTNEKILIVSGDKDYRQLQSYFNVKQWDTLKKKMLIENNPEQYLKEHIIKGDGGDGVPSILDPDDKFVLKIRSKSLRKDKLKQWIHMEPEEFCTEDMLRNYRRNEAMVDLFKIPDHIQKSILDIYEAEANKPGNKLFNYFITHKLKNLTDVIQQFQVNRK